VMTQNGINIQDILVTIYIIIASIGFKYIYIYILTGVRTVIVYSIQRYDRQKLTVLWYYGYTE
jgi:hypothetical protein